MKTFPDKSPGSDLDYVFNWVDWLAGDTIVSYSLMVDGYDGLLTIVSDDEIDGKVIVMLNGGTPNHTYEVSCGILTAGGRTEYKTARIPVRDPI